MANRSNKRYNKKINYKLSKKLKDTGFPDTESYLLKNRRKWEVWQVAEPTKDCLPYPTLSELIQACGKKFVSLSRIENFKENGKLKMKEGFMAQGWDNILCYSKTPEEAVIKLWLKLNSKKQKVEKK